MLSRLSRGLAVASKRQAIRRTALQNARMFSSEIKTTTTNDSGMTTKDQPMQFSKEPIMSNFGELPHGEIPEPLKYVRPFHITTLSNGIRVCSERIPGLTAQVSVYVKAGSRNEDLETTGTSYLLQKMALRGTTSKSKTELAEEIENIGAVYGAKSDREITSYGLKCHKGDAGKAVQLLGDMLCNNTLNSAELELVKQEVSMEHEANHTRYEETLLENVHFNSFREHMLGQPIKGDRDMNSTLRVDHLRDYHSANYIGDNIVVVATGDVSHEQIVDQVEQNFASLPKSTNIPAKNTEKPVYVPALLMLRDDEMINSNVGVFYDAPSIKHDDYYAFLLLKHIQGSFRIDQNAGHLNDV
mmetsp:Transcript_3727/g.6353  ORF Transcript_3727/g.6353 Transcript_3727/m.6353 type:complete len:357 (+) Transcript_3727:34-1104(+)